MMRYRPLLPLAIAVLALVVALVALAVAFLCLGRLRARPVSRPFDNLYQAIADPPRAFGFCIIHVSFSIYGEGPECEGNRRIIWVVPLAAGLGQCPKVSEADQPCGVAETRLTSFVSGITVGDLLLAYGQPERVRAWCCRDNHYTLEWQGVSAYARSFGQGLSMHGQVFRVTLVTRQTERG